MHRRIFLQHCAALGLLSQAGLLWAAKHGRQAHVVVIGAGFAGATAAKYLRLLSNQQVRVTIIEPRVHFISCPMSNLVIGGNASMADITLSYHTLQKKYGIAWVASQVEQIAPHADVSGSGQILCLDGKKIDYDRLIIATGIDFMFNRLPGFDEKNHLHAWKAGAQTQALRQQLQAVPDGGTYAITIPLAPYRCPPGPYERASQVASYFKRDKPKSKVLILDANADVISKPDFFKKSWAQHYPQNLEYISSVQIARLEQNTVFTEVGEKFTANVLNPIPPMQAGQLVQSLPIIKDGWASVDFLSFESKVPGIHVIGDAVLSAPKMPKSGHIANQQGKYCAAAILAILAGQTPNAATYNNTCYSFIDAQQAGHVAAVYRYNGQTMAVVDGSSKVSPQASNLEGIYAKAWAKGIWADVLG